MCGIFGAIMSDSMYRAPTETYDPQCNVAAITDKLAARNLSRGNKQFGFWAWSPAARFRRRFNSPYDQGKLTSLFMQVMLVHVRAPTSGDGDVGEIHPYESKDCVFMMNGILLDYHKKFAQYHTSAAFTDTTYLLGWLQHNLDSRPGEQVHEVLAESLEPVEGQHACLLWHKPTNQLYCWRVMSTLYIRRHSSGSVVELSSARIAGSTLLDQGVVYRLDPNSPYFTGMTKFSYTSPYESQS